MACLERQKALGLVASEGSGRVRGARCVSSSVEIGDFVEKHERRAKQTGGCPQDDGIPLRSLHRRA